MKKQKKSTKQERFSSFEEYRQVFFPEGLPHASRSDSDPVEEGSDLAERSLKRMRDLLSAKRS